MDGSKEHPLMTAGLDLGDNYSYLCLLNQEGGEVLEEGRLCTTPAAFRRRFASEQPMRIAIEAGTHSPWASRVLEECGHEVLLANARKLRTITKERYPVTELLRQVEGIGPLTALTFILTLEHPYRFEKSRSVGAYLGLVPASDRSGERDPQERISKEGDEMLRKLLVGSAHYILGPFGKDSDLRRHGEKIASRGGKNAKKRAVVAVATKLAVLLHSLWVSAEVYEPLRNTHRFGGQAA